MIDRGAGTPGASDCRAWRSTSSTLRLTATIAALTSTLPAGPAGAASAGTPACLGRMQKPSDGGEEAHLLSPLQALTRPLRVMMLEASRSTAFKM